jgi:hypothetical protein
VPWLLQAAALGIAGAGKHLVQPVLELVFVREIVEQLTLIACTAAPPSIFAPAAQGEYVGHAV